MNFYLEVSRVGATNVLIASLSAISVGLIVSTLALLICHGVRMRKLTLSGIFGHWRSSLTGVAIAAALFGVVAGYLAGNSRTGVVGDLLTALVPLVTALGTLFFVKKAENRFDVALGAVAFTMGLLIGLTWGSMAREYFHNSSDAIKRVGDLVTQCLEQQRRIDQVVSILLDDAVKTVKIDCSKYPL